MKFLWLHIGHFGVGTRDGFCEHGKETFYSITGQGFVEQQSELRASWTFSLSGIKLLRKNSTEFLTQIIRYAVIPDILFTTWSTRYILLLSDTKLHHTFARPNELNEFPTSCYYLRVRSSYLKR